MNRVAITGLGVVCPLGSNVEAFWRRLIAGKSGIGPITKIDPTGLRNEEGGEIVDFDWSIFSDDLVDEATQYAFAASVEALRDAQLILPQSPTLPVGRPRTGVAFSTNFGGAASWESFVESGEVEAFREFGFHRAAAYTSQVLGLAGPSITLSNSCSSGVSAIGCAFDQIRLGRADVMVAGGHDGLGLSSLAGLSILRTITAEKCRPFDKNRSGTIFGEGAGIVVLEDLAHARQRNARIYGEVSGYALNNNAYHLTAPDKGGAGMAQVLRRALKNASTPPESIDYINAHGTGTQYHDPAETQAIKEVLGPRAYEIPVSSIKGATSHTMAAAGAIEAIATVLAMRDSVVPPTVNYETPDPDCDLDVVPNEAKAWKVDAALSISAGIGGNNGAIVISRWKQED
ncbi:MAG: beta-ketoacyl-[acyl-carrier-protein] synthase family protein [Armatimonadetes bacterium]|nr:beta-ketoacyl-[acyl-carrier-protein] synthase family protein [Armatimonadota bacterium]